MPRKTIIECRKKLQKRGLIDFQEGEKKAKNPYYFFVEVTKRVTLKVTKKVTKNVTLTASVPKVSPTPPSKDNIYNNKETSSYDDVKKASLPSPTSLEDEGSPKSERMDWAAFMQTFNDMLSPGIPKIISLSQSRRDKVKAIVREFGKQAVMDALQKVRDSDFLMGRNRRPDDNWKCGFDFIFTKSKFIKILEGNYDNGTHQAPHSEKRSVNQQVFADFLAEREQRAGGMAYEVEKPF